MAFTRIRLDINEDYAIGDGVIPARNLSRLNDTDLVIERMIGEAESQADEIKNSAFREADQILKTASLAAEKASCEAAQRDRERIDQINAEWRQVLGCIEPAVVAMTTLAIAKICNELSMAEKIEMTVSVAMRELPERPIRIRIPPEASECLPSALTQSIEISLDGSLPSSAVCMEGEYSSCDADFSEGKKAVSNILESWICRSLDLVKRD